MKKKIETLYGIEVIIHVPTVEPQMKGTLVMPNAIPDWVEGTVIHTGLECKKGLQENDKVMITKETYQTSPNISKNQFDLPDMPKGTFHIMTEYMIAMKVSDVPNSENNDN